MTSTLPETSPAFRSAVRVVVRVVSFTSVKPRLAKNASLSVW